jgi:hypothetical protein
MFSILLTPLVKGGVEGEIFILGQWKEKLLFLGEVNFHL